MSSIVVEIDESTVKRLVIQHLQEKLGDLTVEISDIEILVRSKQNYKDKEWENGEFKATYKCFI